MGFKEFYEANKERFLQELKEFLSIPSISTDPAHKKDINAAVDWLKNKLETLGFETKTLLPTKPSLGKNANPVLYAEYTVDKNKPTIMIYGHYDVQPPEPLDEWKTPPFAPDIRDGKIYARGANDNKGQLYANIIAAEYYIKEVKEKQYNIKFFIEGEEEIGGPTTNEIIEDSQFKDILAVDTLWIADGPWIAHNKPSVVYALRGIAYFDLYLENLPQDIHSGIYGNVVLNPANLAGYVIFKLKDILRNRIRIPKIYKSVRKPSKEEIKLVEAASPTYDEIKQEVNAGVVTPYRRKGTTFPPLVLTGLKPSLDVHGIYSGFTKPGQLKTIIPANAWVKFSIRLVPHLTVEKTEELVRSYLQQIIPKGVTWKLTRLFSGDPFYMDPARPELKKLLEVVKEAFGKDPVLVPEGGSIGLVTTFARKYNPAILMPNYGLPDDGLHSPNEKFNLSQLEGGAKTLVLYLTKK